MGRLIDADKLKAHYAWWENFENLKQAKKDFDTIVDVQPTVEAEPTKHGRWTQVWHGKLLPWDTTCCSVCGVEAFYDEVNGYYKSDYCPNCGARMDGGENG